MEVIKSSRHSKITGDCGEALVLYWLSKYGFECARVDHTGIDLIARNPHSQELMGISVKSRSRSSGTEADPVNVRLDDFTKVELACEAFGCNPYFAIVVDAGSTIRAFLLPMQHLNKLCAAKKVASWKMSAAHLKQYATDSIIKSFELGTATPNWWNSEVVLESQEPE